MRLLIGAGAATLAMFALSVCGIPWNRWTVSIAVVAGVAAAASAVARSRDGRGYTATDLLLLVPLAAYAFFVTQTALYEWDFFGIWGLKGRVFFEHHGIDWRFIRTNVSHPDYPLFLPLLFDFIAVLLGEWNETALALVYVALSAALIVFVRARFAEELPPKWASPATLAVAFPSLNPWIGLAEGPVMVYGCAGLLAVRSGRIHLGAVLLGFAAWSKNEGLALIVVAAIALFIATRRVRDVMKLWPAVAIIAPWMITRAVLRLPTDFAEGDVFTRVLERVRDFPAVARAFLDAPPDQPFFWIVVLLAIAFCAREAFTRERFLTIAVILQVGLMFAQAFATRYDLAAHINLTMNRLPHQLAPAFAFLAASLLMRRLVR